MDDIEAAVLHRPVEGGISHIEHTAGVGNRDQPAIRFFTLRAPWQQLAFQHFINHRKNLRCGGCDEAESFICFHCLSPCELFGQLMPTGQSA